MKNRKLPFGYKMEQGKPVIYPREAEMVTVIFRQYTMGASYLALVKMLKNQPVPYDTNRLWNKNMVARILEDSRYLGQEDFPAVIEEKLFRQVAQKRNTKQVAQLTESQKLLRRLKTEVDRTEGQKGSRAAGLGFTERPDRETGNYPAATSCRSSSRGNHQAGLRP